MAASPTWNSGGTAPLYSSDPWRTGTIAGKRLPGDVTIADGLVEIGVDNKKPDGKDGGQIVVKGYRPGPFDIVVEVCTDEQGQLLKSIIDEVWTKPKKKSKVSEVAVDVYHPALEFVNVTPSCVLKGISFPRPGSIEGSKVVTFKCLENVPAGKKNKTKKAGPSVSVVPSLRKTPSPNGEAFAGSSHSAPTNATPPKPSTVKKNLGPKGPRTPPAAGND